ncbi:hypothetical protein [Chroococcidiopsis sp. TS-821]|uniref:hypothetical protein n=1 Tax=Chroococcidiopsis sp. TS-821 TaxID=1378066 RepID=UPI0011AFF18E|nr:hypothetical protein [Chroococcidiopsis sp. TS-821]
MFELPTELQWERLCSLVAVLSLARRFICKMEIVGGFLYVTTQSCDADNQQIYILDSQGELL